MLKPAQIKMARAGLGMSVRELAEQSGVADSTILRFESGRGTILASNLGRLQRTLEKAGALFLDADATGGPGVRINQADAR